MNRFLDLPSLAVVICGLLRCTGGVLGCTAMAGAISIGAAASADAAARVEPEPRRPMPLICRHAMSTGDRHTVHRCRRAWPAMQERSRRRSGRDGEFHRRGDRYDRPRGDRRRSPSPWRPEGPLGGRPTPQDTPSTAPPPPGRPEARTSRRSSPKPTPARPSEPSAEPPPARSAEPSAEPPPARFSEPAPTRSPGQAPTASQQPAPASSPQPTLTGGRADDLGPQPPLLRPVLLLGLLLPAVAAICYPFRHRLYAAAGAPQFSTTGAAGPPPAHFGYRPTLDPFAAPVIGLTGSGAAAAARILALTALDEHGGNSLVVIPRPDTTALFGLAEDELLDDDTAALFIPGNLDAALAYLETELAIRENTGVTQARRLLLVADPDSETDRIDALLDRHPGGLSVILLGARTGDRASVDGDGLVDAPPAVAVRLPERLPAMSRTEARDRLFSCLARHGRDRKPPSKRRSTSRRP